MPLYKTPAGNILFIHVPKTGGTSIEMHLGAHFSATLAGERLDPALPVKSQHYHRDVLRRFIGETPVAYSFMVVRNPVDRIVSEFKFQSRKPLKAYRRLYPFSRWLRRNLNRATTDPSLRDNHFRPQHEFEAFAPEIFRFEDGLGAVYDKISAVTGLARPANDIHAWKSRKVEIAVSAADIDIIREFYRIDFERYGYG